MRNAPEGGCVKPEGFVELGYAKADTSRAARQGAGEVIYGEGKTAEQIANIARALVEGGQERVLVTRLDAEKAAAVEDLWASFAAASAGEPAGEDAAATEGEGAPSVANAVGGNPAAEGNPSIASVPYEYFAQARLAVMGGFPEADGNGVIVVAAAGTSDLVVAEEAALTAEFLGNRVERLYDVGVAGIHRLLAYEDLLVSAQVVIAVAGMEGALPSVVGGLVACPVLAVPTSVGYGASFGGVTALLAMLNSCASGISVVNIDNGFGAGYQASLINHL